MNTFDFYIWGPGITGLHQRHHQRIESETLINAINQVMEWAKDHFSYRFGGWGQQLTKVTIAPGEGYCLGNGVDRNDLKDCRNIDLKLIATYEDQILFSPTKGQQLTQTLNVLIVAPQIFLPEKEQKLWPN